MCVSQRGTATETECLIPLVINAAINVTRQKSIKSALNCQRLTLKSGQEHDIIISSDATNCYALKNVGHELILRNMRQPFQHNIKIFAIKNAS